MPRERERNDCKKTKQFAIIVGRNNTSNKAKFAYVRFDCVFITGNSFPLDPPRPNKTRKQCSRGNLLLSIKLIAERRRVFREMHSRMFHIIAKYVIMFTRFGAILLENRVFFSSTSAGAAHCKMFSAGNETNQTPMFIQNAVTSLRTQFTENDSQKNDCFGLKLAYFHNKLKPTEINQFLITTGTGKTSAFK